MNSFDILKQAEEAGWTDPGLTEPLEATVARAQEYLADRAAQP